MRRKAARAGYTVFTEGLFERMISKAEKTCSEPVSSWLAVSSRVGFYMSAVSLVQWSDTGNFFEIFKELGTRKCCLYGDTSTMPSVPDTAVQISMKRLPESGRFCMIDNPDAFYEAVTDIVTGGGS